MQPSFDLRIRTMIKALSETILPSVDRGNRAAIEQGHLVIGSLHLLNEQIDYAHWFETVEAKGLLGLVEALATAFPGPEAAAATATAGDARVTVERHDITLSTLRQANLGLRDAITAIIEAAHSRGDDGVRNSIDALVLAHGEGQIAIERAFVAGTGFDVAPESLLSIEESLRRTSSGR